MSGNAYQLRYPRVRLVGSYVVINGPYDKYGQVYAVDVMDVTPAGILHKVRGIGKKLPKGKVAYGIAD